MQASPLPIGPPQPGAQCGADLSEEVIEHVVHQRTEARARRTERIVIVVGRVDPRTSPRKYCVDTLPNAPRPSASAGAPG